MKGKVLFTVVALILVFFSAPIARTTVAMSLAFGLGPGGSISWSGGGASVLGKDMPINSITANNGQSLSVSDGMLTLTSGPSTGGRTFGPGGSITVTGAILDSSDESLLSVTFNSAEKDTPSGVMVRRSRKCGRNGSPA